MNTEPNDIMTTQASFEYRLLKFGFCTLLLYLIALYVNHAPHNIFITLSALLGLTFLLSNPKKHFKNYKSDFYFFSALIAYAAFYVLFNIYHLKTLDDMAFALERVRWVVYALVVFPMVKQIVVQKVYKDPSLLKFKAFILVLAMILTTLIFMDSISRVLYGQPFTAKWFSNLSSHFYTRASWTYNPIPFSQISFFAGVLFLLSSWKVWLTRQKIAWVFLLAGIGMLIVTLFTQTRATWLGFLVFGAALFVFHRQSRKKIIIFAGLAALAISLSGENELKTRMYSITSKSKFSNVYRKEHWAANLKLARENLFTGVGYAENRKPAVIDPFLKKFTKRTHLMYGHSHNEYLDVLSGMGLASFILFLFILAYPAVKLIRSNKRKDLAAAACISFLCFIYSAAFFDLISLTSWSTIIAAWYFCLLYKGANHETHLRV